MKECKGKEVIFPREVKPDSEETRQQYIKTHGNYAPGEMVDRKYHWPIDRGEFAFGVTDKNACDSVKAALAMDRTPTLDYPQTRIVPLTAETYRQVNNDPIGRARNNMQGAPPLPPGHAYGIKCIGSDSTVGDCLRGWYPLKEQLPDPDLGKSIPVEEFLLRRPKEELESILQCAEVDTSKFGEIY